MSGLTHVLFEELRAPGVQSMILKSGPPFLIFIKSRAYKLVFLLPATKSLLVSFNIAH